MKQLELDYHFIRHRVQSKELQVSYVSIKDQLADGFTKALATLRFKTLRSKTGVSGGTPVLRGQIKDTLGKQLSSVQETESRSHQAVDHDLKCTSISTRLINPT